MDADEVAAQLGGRHGRDLLDERGGVELGVLEREPEQVQPDLAGAVADLGERPPQRGGARSSAAGSQTRSASAAASVRASADSPIRSSNGEPARISTVAAGRGGHDVAYRLI